MQAELISADPVVQKLGDDVLIHRLTPRHAGRLYRFCVVGPRAVLHALLRPAALYHFHDPELLPWAWLLLLRRVPVVYDVHEDYSLAIEHKRHLPAVVRRRGGHLLHLLERFLSWPFSVVIAEQCYAGRFPEAHAVLNYPRRELLDFVPAHAPQANRLLYTGNITRSRGALELAWCVRDIPDLELTLAGHCAPELAAELRSVAGVAGAGRLHILGEGQYLPFDQIAALYSWRTWLAAVVLVPPSPHYREKHLTKFFEYMAVGLPIICTDVPAWRALIQEQGVGLCVDPKDTAAVAGALRYLKQHPEQAREMGRRGRELVRTRYNWEGQAQKLLRMYQSLINAS